MICPNGQQIYKYGTTRNKNKVLCGRTSPDMFTSILIVENELPINLRQSAIQTIAYSFGE